MNDSKRMYCLVVKHIRLEVVSVGENQIVIAIFTIQKYFYSNTYNINKDILQFRPIFLLIGAHSQWKSSI